MLSPTSLSILGTGNVNALTFGATQSNASGNFTVTTAASGSTSCSAVATVSPTSGTGPFTVTGLAAGTCSFTVSGDSGISAPLSVTVTTVSVGGS